MLAPLLIMLREGLEAALVLGIIAAYLRRTGRSGWLSAIWLGVLLAVALSLFGGAALQFLQAGFPQKTQEAFEAAVALVAAAVLTWMVFWMQTASRSIRTSLERDLDGAFEGPGRATVWALVGMAFLAVAREGLESVFFLLAIFQQSPGPAAPFAALAGVAIAVDRAHRLPDPGRGVPRLDPKLPPADGGILGPVLRPDGLTITVAVGSSLFDRSDWLAPYRPAQLHRMTAFPNDALDADLCHGDLAIQICANTQDAIIHALRDLIKNIPDQLVLRWKQEGNVPVIAPQPPAAIESARNFLGFRDGSANPVSGDAALMDRILWVQAASEPEWARGGAYRAVRIIRNFVERWDRTPLSEQERIVGRTKVTGGPLDRPDGSETDTPDYAADAGGRLTPLDSHIRLANPRDALGERHLILRRPFNYSNGVTRSGQLDQGLLFIAWQADLAEGFIAAQTRLNGEPLEECIKPVGGGYFYALPGFGPGNDDYLGRQLIDAIGRNPRKA